MNEILTVHAQKCFNLISENLKEVEATKIEKKIISSVNFEVYFTLNNLKYKYEYKINKKNVINAHTFYAVYDDKKTELLRWGSTIKCINSLLYYGSWKGCEEWNEKYKKYHE